MEKNTLCEARKIGELRKEHANLAKIKENNADIRSNLEKKVYYRGLY